MHLDEAALSRNDLYAFSADLAKSSASSALRITNKTTCYQETFWENGNAMPSKVNIRCDTMMFNTVTPTMLLNSKQRMAIMEDNAETKTEEKC